MLLAALLATLETLDRQVAELEVEMAGLLPHTEGAKLTQIDGIGTVAASGFVAFVGSARRWGTGPRCGVAPGWTRPAPSPDPPT